MKKAFFTGLIILLPITMTLIVVSFIINIFASPFLNLVISFLHKIAFFQHYPHLTSILAKIIILILFLLFLLLLGCLARKIIFRSFFKSFNALLMKIPLFNSIYNVAKDLIGTFVSTDESKSFKNPVSVHFPNKSSSSLGFLSKPVPIEIQEKFDDEMIAIFVPSSPQPISGYLLFTYKKNVKDLDMTNEEALKFTVSCGIIRPEKK